MNFDFTEEQQLIRSTVREFAETVLAPRAREMDEKAEFPWEEIKKMAEQGYLGAQIPKEYGGSELDTVSYAIMIEEISRVVCGIGLTLQIHNSACAQPIAQFGTEEQKKRFLPRLAKGELIGAFALTEPGAGSDAQALRTTATPDGDEYILNGSKIFITSGPVAGVALVFATTPSTGDAKKKPISAFLVEKGTPGFSAGPKEDKMGMRAAINSELIFDNCRIPKANLLGKEGDGFRIAMTILDSARIGASAQAVGLARAAFEEALKYSQQRQQFSRPIAQFQAIQFMLAEMATQIEAASLLTYRAAYLKDKGARFTKEVAMAKLYSSRMCTEVVSKALQIHGGYGYMKDYPIERYYRDAKVLEIYEGTSEVQRMVIAGQLLKS
ncbi:MAG: acyl-CoA dehydrogenase [Candidatus Freyarchaeota archaeon]|nr:acyl-CoA dehydrogenase [Candidatus Jordarchaeia archaeon]MBS7267447.1 acyl-CoA dehydrogenase [Candidatus Jordarchaeia archaeon]